VAEYSAFAVFAVANELARGSRGCATAPPHLNLPILLTDNLFAPALSDNELKAQVF